MIWKYRIINNPAARRKWIIFYLCLFGVCLFYSILNYKGTITLLSFSFFTLMLFLYAIITLGKIRYYYIEDDIIRYKPFKTYITNIEDFEINRDLKIIKLKLKRPSIFAVKTLYFEDINDLEEVAKFLKKRINR
ncbi:MAG TPA: hypothetical protein EYH04_05680 [Archaeoglobus profundus]|nr:hypothetical protein [Archaeoglobus profundus]